MKKAISFLILILLCVAITPGAGTEPGKIVFDDKNLESALSKIIGKPVGKIEKADLEKLTKLDLSKKKISSLKGIEHCRNLTQLILSVNLVKDISPLANLTKLTELKLYNNKIEDISPLLKMMEKGVLAKGASVFLMKNNMNIKKGTLNRKVIEALGKKGIIVKWQNGNIVD